jgi:hypothetical protein
MSAEFKWKTTFVLHNVRVDAPILFDGIRIEPHPKSSESSPMVKVTYRFTTPRSPPDFIQFARDIVGRFLDVSSAHSALVGLDVREVMEEFDVELENFVELSKAGVHAPTKISINIQNKVTWNEGFVRYAWDWMKKLSSHKDADVIFRVLRLLRQSMVEEDEYERLSKVWRSFNALYAHLAKTSKSSQPNLIKCLCVSLLRTNSKLLTKIIEESWATRPKPTPIRVYLDWILAQGNWANVMDCLIKQKFVDKYHRNYSQTLSTAVSTQNAGAALESALLCIYVERNKVMHGEIISDEEREVLYVCAAFLQGIVAVALNEFYFIPMQASSQSSSTR